MDRGQEGLFAGSGINVIAWVLTTILRYLPTCAIFSSSDPQPPCRPLHRLRQPQTRAWLVRRLNLKDTERMITNLIGRQLGNYRLTKLLGEGGFASVYLGQHVQIATQQAAIKVLHLMQVNTQQFRKEAETIAALKHPHIVRLLDFAIEQGTPFLVLDYAPNGSLRTRHADGEQLPLETIMQYVAQLADALQYAHDNHIIHRDIKPDNVLIDQHGTLLLSDFGIAKISKTGRSARSVTHGAAGTPYYMAPEMFKGKSEKASDQYALAVMVYRWLSGTLPFSEGNAMQLGIQHVQNPVPPLRGKVPTISEDVEAVIMRALSKESQDRFASVREFAEALEVAGNKPAIGRQLGNYRLTKLLGEGGFASVYLGQHVQITAQQAAIKVLHLTQVNTQQFRQEAETIAALKHPHIVRLLDFDIQRGTPFLVMDYAHNGSLRARHAADEKLPLATVMEYVTQIADALQYAHDKNIIHRDIKPDNVLIDQHGTLLLSDFGIAVISKMGRTTRSVSYGVAGTPYYMAPEMFKGKPEKASDQYSLAIMVYQWLSGTLPFGGHPIILGHQHEHDPVPPLRDKVPAISEDVEAVIMIALSKKPQDRFASVRAFAEALDAASKKPAIGQQLGNYRLIELLGEGGFASVYLGQHVRIERQRAAIKVLHLAGVDPQKFQQEAETIAALKHPHIVRLLDFDIQPGTGTPFLVMDYAPNGSLGTRHAADEQLPLATVIQYVTQIANALQYAHDKHHIIHCDIKPDNVLIDQQGELLLSDFGIAVMSQTGRTTVQSATDISGTPEYMAPEMFTAQPVLASDQYALAVMAYQWLSGTLPFGEGDIYQLSYQHTHEPVPPLRDQIPTISVAVEAVVLRGLAKQPQDRFPSVRAFAEALDSASKKPPIGTRLLTYRGHNDAPGYDCAWSPDGTRLATGGTNGLLKIWDAMTGQLILTCEDRSAAPINAVAWSPDGRRVASGSEDKTVQVWDVGSGKALLSFNGHSSSVQAVAWSPDGRRVASGSEDKTVQVWDVGSGKALLSFNGHSSSVQAVAWSPDGRRVASGSEDKTVQVWDAASGKALLSFNGHSELVQAVAWSPDGRRVASGSEDKTVQVWDAASGKALLSFNGHSSAVHAVAWSPDGRRVASGSEDKTVQVWDAASGKALLSFNGHSSLVWAVAWSPDGRRVASGSEDKTVQVWDAASGKALLSFNGHSSLVWAVAWSPDGHRLASATGEFVDSSDNKTVQVWDAASGKALLSFNGHSAWVQAVAWSPDGRRVASGSWDKTVQVWDAASGKALLSFNGHSERVRAVAWSPDGRRVASGSYDNTVQVWDAASGKALLSFNGHSERVRAVAWSPDGRRVASASDDKTVQVWDAASGALLYTYDGHGNGVAGVAWSPDGRRVASSAGDPFGSDNTVQVWDAASGKALLSFNGHSSSVNTVAWSPDGRRVASASDDKTVQVWDAASGALLYTYDGHGNGVAGLAWSPDGTCIASGAWNGVVVVWQAV